MQFTRLDGAAWAVVAAALAYAVLKPIWDWDVIPYLFLAKMLGGVGVAEAHGWVYGVVAGMPEHWRADLLGREEFRQIVARDPESLRQVSRFYAERLGYYGLVAGLMKVFGPLGAVQVVNALGQVVLGGTVWAWLRRLRLGWWGVLVLAVVLAFPSVMKVARWSNPDGLVAGLLVLGVYLAVFRRDGWFGVAWLAMVMLKPNTALWVAPLGVLWLWRRDWGRVAMLALVGVMAGLLHFGLPPYGLILSLKHAFVGAYAYPETVHLGWDFGFWLTCLSERMLGLHGRDLLVFGVFVVSAGLALARGGQRGVALALLVGVVAQVLAFPGFWERLYIGPVLAMGLLAAEGWRKRA
jgi:hypothetical protein